MVQTQSYSPAASAASGPTDSTLHLNSFIEQALAILSQPTASSVHDLGLAEHPLIRHTHSERICVGQLMTVDWQPVDLPHATDSRLDLESKPPASLLRRVREVFRARLEPPGGATYTGGPATDEFEEKEEIFRVVYVSRATAKSRRVVNEAELIEGLRRELERTSVAARTSVKRRRWNRYELEVFTAASLRETMQTFGSARCVVIRHSAVRCKTTRHCVSPIPKASLKPRPTHRAPN
mmetsp:Transcript_72953/g.207911  ORF Transcript_72953/g.207911 Transcript_72953/m.207911 type:complete len:237 (+) Transcript_72953:649-1359(+)